MGEGTKRTPRAKRDRGFVVMMTEAERNRVHALAAKLGVSASDVVRAAVNSVAEKHGVAA